MKRIFEKAKRLNLALKGGLNLNSNPQKRVKGRQLNSLLTSSMFAVEDLAYLNSFETGLDEHSLDVLVHQYWKIYDREAANEILDHLLKRNRNENLAVIYEAYEVADYADFLKFRLKEDEEDIIKEYIVYLEQLFKVVPTLIEQGVFTDYKQVKKVQDLGWNVSRGAFLARACYDLGYFELKELQIHLDRFYKELQGRCSTWREYTQSYLLGRAIEEMPHQENCTVKAEKLLTSKRSPLYKKIKLA